ncbi:carboxypeptidase regulatory-like domain-containing protein [Ferruginibacter paludis]|uniref:TonB-dependent receptor n=1 Tax=Ferruginibacter paludis TaxID=1310417 RepID=UPI0025B2FE37|nr:carboxypeptidase regulatory-like domain-containing protein [Ferruginibacter paludis]MDN3656186.1 carboxypeptidase regulatory-like domain-containing protein [Ferruginibacter paludis]
MMQVFLNKKIILGLCFLLLVCSAFAQSSGSGISGFVYTDDNQPFESATVTVSNPATGFTTATSTNKKGYFTLRDLPVGNYNIQVSAAGAQPTFLKDNALNLGDRLVLNKIVLSKNAATLSQVTVRSNSFTNSVDRLGTGTAVSGRAIQKIPLASRNYTDLMVLSPLASGASLAGAKAGGTGYMLDGVSNRRATFGGTTDAAFSISSETIREFEVSTNSYDVTNGRGSGGVVKAITKSGTNTLSGAAWGYYGANSLAATKDVNGNHLTSKYQIKQGGALLSGPIIKDKIHFLISYDQYQNTIPFRAYDFTFAGATQAQAEKNLNITKANLDQIVGIMQNQFGFPANQQYGTINIVQETKNAFAKFDWNINKKNLLTLKYNYLHFVDPNKLKGSGLLTTQYTGVEIDNAVMLGLRTELSSNLVNDLKVNFSTYRKFLKFVNNHVPEGFVNVNSTFADGSTGNTTVAFGVQNWVPERDASDVIQLVDNLRYKTGNLNFVFGTDNNINHVTDRLSHDQQGQFYYASIADMANNKPYRFNRKIPLDGINPKISVPIIELGLFAQMETNLKPNLNLTVGLRWDANIIGSKPTYNEQLYKDLGVRSDVVPFDAKNVQPRVNLIWDVHGNGKDLVKFGSGLFASELTTQPITFSHIDNGVDFRQVDIRQNVPVPDWAAYQQDFSKVPGVDYYNSLPTKQPATVLVLDKNLKNPLTFKTSLSYYHFFNNWLRAGANVYYDRTWDNFYLYDLNLRKTPQFVTNEGREVYVPAASLTGSSSTSYLPVLANSRISSNFNQVRYFTNTKWASQYLGAVVEVAAQLRKDGYVSVSYARGKATGTPPYDNGDPRNSNFSVASSYSGYADYGKNWYSDGDQANKIVALFLSPTIHGFSISSSFQAYQNARYSAYVNKDVIGEGNDGTNLAFIYDPNSASTPSDIASGMNNLLAKTSPEYKKFLLKNMGKFAPYNGGLMPWRTQWNLSVAYDIKLVKTHKITLRADFFNVLNLINYKWGGYSQIINTNLYNVTGFDAETSSYKYSVNTNAGTKIKTATYYSVQLGARYSF